MAEAYRVLKPRGYLVLADILFHRLPGNIRPYVPVENYVPDEGAYRQEFLAAGFTSVITVDATQACCQEYLRHTLRWAMRQLRARRISLVDYLRLISLPLVGPLMIKHYLLAAAYKA
jgi:ubiquinone/menaquinone biosynthesis C-methylase UbiE